MPIIDDSPSPQASIMPPNGGFDVTPSDAVELPRVTRAVMVSTRGNLRVQFVDGTIITLPELETGVQYIARLKRIYATGTTATGIKGLY